MIFFAAASVSLLSTFAFIFLVPAHVRPQTPRVPAPQQQQEQQQPLASTDSAAMLTQPLLEPSASSTSSSPAPAALAAAQQQQGAAAPAQGAGFSLKQFMKDVTSMGADYYRMLSVICLYALGHINESLLEARAIEVGFGKAECTLVIAALCGVTFLVAYPLGRLDDK